MIIWLRPLNFAVSYETCMCSHTHTGLMWLSPTGLIHKNMLKPTKKAIAHICKPLGLITKCSTGIIAETKPYVGLCSTLICSQGWKLHAELTAALIIMRTIISGKERSPPTKPYCLRVPVIQKEPHPTNCSRTMEPVLSNNSYSLSSPRLLLCGKGSTVEWDIRGWALAQNSTMTQMMKETWGQNWISLPLGALIFIGINKTEPAEVKVRRAPSVLSWSRETRLESAHGYHFLSVSVFIHKYKNKLLLPVALWLYHFYIIDQGYVYM